MAESYEFYQQYYSTITRTISAGNSISFTFTRSNVPNKTPTMTRITLTGSFNTSGSLNVQVKKQGSTAIVASGSFLYTGSSTRVADLSTGLSAGTTYTVTITSSHNASINSILVQSAWVKTFFYLTAGGQFPTYVEEIKFTDGTSFTVTTKSVEFTSSKAIKSITLTDTAISGKWTGQLYWSSSAGGKTYLIASINKGVVSMASNIETIDYSGESRTIYFTEVGGYPYRTVHLRLSNGVEQCQIRYTNIDTHTTSSLWLDNTYKTIKAETGFSISISSVTYKSINSQNCRNAAFEKWNHNGTFSSHLNSTSYSVTGTALDSDIYLRVGAETPIGFYTNGGLWSDNRSSQPKFYWHRIYDNVNLSTPSGLITKEGYTLLGWSEGSGTYIPGHTTVEKVQLLTDGPFYFYAVWGTNLFLQCGEGTKEITFKIGSWKTIGIANQDFEKVAVPLDDGTDTTKLTISAISTTGYERPMQVTFKNGPQGQILTRVTVLEVSQSYSYANDANHQKHNYVTVNFVPALTRFTWCGNDILDDKNIATGQPVSNLTAEAWNRYKTSLSTIKAKWGLTDIFPGNDVDQNDAITAEEFNKIVTALQAISSQKVITTNYIPFNVKTGDIIKASFFNNDKNNRDLKHAINFLISQVNGQ